MRLLSHALRRDRALGHPLDLFLETLHGESIDEPWMASSSSRACRLGVPSASSLDRNRHGFRRTPLELDQLLKHYGPRLLE